MAHPQLWPKTTFFYPIGNTTAFSLVQDLRPDEDAKILLLGCGDPRNILYTIYASGADSAKAPRTLDFTCCDVEPAILARNVLLFTMLMDDGALDRIPMIWNIFYHFYLDKTSLSLLLEQCKKLVKVSDTLETWRSSHYAPSLRVCTTHTLSELRRYWSLYVQTEQFSKKEKKNFKDAFTAGAKVKLARQGVVLTASRSAGPLWFEAIQVVSDLFKRYWETGLTTLDPKEIAEASCVNPTLAYAMSGEAFPMHYGTDPLSSYHLARAFVPLKSAPTDSHSHGSTNNHDIYSVVKEQFYQWCKSLKVSLSDTQKPPKIIIRLFVGDAIAFCRALQSHASDKTIFSGMYTAPWGAAELVLDGGDYGGDARYPAPLLFNVIDTSNLTDHLGLLNILTITIPLLSKRPSSALYTEMLLRSGEDATNGFIDRVCADIPAISLLLGLVPSTYVSKFTTHSNIHEILAFRAKFFSAQFHERIAWKTAYMGDTLAVQADDDVSRPASFDAKSLAKLLFSIYLKMFAEEEKFGIREGSPKAVEAAISAATVIHYVRGSFAALLRIVKHRVRTDWTLVMNTLDDFLVTDRKFPLGINNYQDLCCQLHLLGVHSVEPLLPQTIARFDKSRGRFRQWATVPPVVCVVLSIPRSKVKILEDIHPDEIGSPILLCEVRGTCSHSIFSSIHAVFGHATPRGTEEDREIILDADPSGLSGTSGLIVSFWMPSWILMMEPQTTQIGLAIRMTPATIMLLVPKLGVGLTLFLTPLFDEEHVFLVRERPRLVRELKNIGAAPFTPELTPSTKSKVHPVAVNLDSSGQRVLTLTAHADIVEANDKRIWSTGAPVTVVQASSCAVSVNCGDFNQVLVFPFPIDGSRSKLRIARKSFYVEVVAPLNSVPITADKYHLNNFPVILQDNTLTVWNIHHLRLDRIPALDISRAHKLDWINPHVSLMFSDCERAVREKQTQVTSGVRDVMVDVKDTLHALFTSVAGVHGSKYRVFGLTDPSRGGIYTLIFVTDFRLDLASHTIVADACILPLTHTIVEEISNTLTKLHNDGLVKIQTLGEEVTAWKRLLPALTERCREWKHKASCEYIVQGVVPLSLKMAETPICSCGQGVGIDAFRKVKEWKAIAKYVTRAAIGPLFAVSYLESVATFTKEMEGRLFNTQASPVPRRCAMCAGSGKPKLLTCSKCKKASYCTSVCQREDWQRHKRECK